MWIVEKVKVKSQVTKVAFQPLSLCLSLSIRILYPVSYTCFHICWLYKVQLPEPILNGCSLLTFSPTHLKQFGNNRNEFEHSECFKCVAHIRKSPCHLALSL